jgi:Rrf2 family protein
MILISRKVDYGILALHHLMLHSGGVSARELADHYNLSRAFIANILKQLCQEGFVDSQRGVHGGYRLARKPSEINLAEIITALDGPFQLMSCASDTVDPPCGLSDVCPVRSPLSAIHDQLLTTLAGFTLEDLWQKQQDPPLVKLAVENKADGCIADLSR